MCSKLHLCSSCWDWLWRRQEWWQKSKSQDWELLVLWSIAKTLSRQEPSKLKYDQHNMRSFFSWRFRSKRQRLTSSCQAKCKCQEVWCAGQASHIPSCELAESFMNPVVKEVVDVLAQWAGDACRALEIENNSPKLSYEPVSPSSTVCS